jgi:hypothetical protein
MQTVPHIVNADQRQRWSIVYLLTLKQKESKSLKYFMARFNKEKLAINKQDEIIVLVTLL